MRLVNARLCLDCEEVHDEQHCPICGSESFAFLTRWVTPSDTIAAGAAPRTSPLPAPVDRREQVDVYKQILNPAPQPRRSRLVASGALGLALLGVARMWWRATPDGKTEKLPDRKPEARKGVDQGR